MKSIKLLFGIVLILFSLNFVNAVDLETDLRSAYNFNNNDFSDLTLNGYNLTNNATTNTSGVIRDGRDFDGTNQYLARETTNGNPLYDIGTGDFSFSTWINPDVSQSKYILYFGTEEGGNEDGVVLRLSGNILIYGITEDTTGTNQIVSNATLNSSQWYHVVGVRNSGTMALYLNSNPDGTNLSDSSNLDSANFKNRFTIGVQKVDGGAYQNFFNGQQDIILIYNRSLSHNEITELYNSGSGKEYPLVSTLNPTINFQEVKLDNITNFNNTIYNSTPQLLEVTLNTTDTNNNTNVTFYMYNSSNSLITTYQFQNESLTGSYNISFPYQDTFKFYLYAENNETNATIGNYTITYTLPPLNVSLISPLGESYNVTKTMVFAVNITNVTSLVTKNVQVTLPDTTKVNYSLTSTDGIQYNYTYTIPNKIGVFYGKFIIIDNNGQVNDSVISNFTATDGTNPSVTLLTPSPGSAYSDNVSVVFGATVTDNIALSSVKAQLDLPNGTSTNYTLTSTLLPTWNYTYTTPSLAGLYNLTFIATDSSGNVNNSVKSNFTVSVDSCTAPEINNNWIIDGGDNCIINGETIDLGTGFIYFTGNGTITFNNSVVTTAGFERQQGDTGVDTQIYLYSTTYKLIQ